MYELALLLKCSNKELLATIRSMGIEVNNHMSSLNGDDVRAITCEAAERALDRTRSSSPQAVSSGVPVIIRFRDRSAGDPSSAPSVPTQDAPKAAPRLAVQAPPRTLATRTAPETSPPQQPELQTETPPSPSAEPLAWKPRRRQLEAEERQHAEQESAQAPPSLSGKSRFEVELERARARARERQLESEQLARMRAKVPQPPQPAEGQHRTGSVRSEGARDQRLRETSHSPPPRRSPPLLVLDGLNIARWHPDRNADLSIVVAVCRSLQLASRGYFCCFDASARHALAEARKYYDRLLAQMPDCFGSAPGGSQADEFVLQIAHQEEGVVLSQDLFKEYRATFPWIADPNEPSNVSRTSGRVVRGAVMRGQVVVPSLGLSLPVPPVSELARYVDELVAAR